MGQKYRQLNEKDRIFLNCMLNKGYTKIKIATVLGVHRSTIHREIKRNSCLAGYGPDKFYYSGSAHIKYLKRRRKVFKVEKDKELKQYIHDKLIQGWSPWQIEGRLKSEGGKTVTHESIYRYIYGDISRRNLLGKYLRRKHKVRVKLGTRKSRLPEEMQIKMRPDYINNREDFGHWECDLMIFKRNCKANFITLRERKTRYMIAVKNPNRSANTTAINIISTLKNLKSCIKSITFDQGFEFSKYAWIKECLEASIYFCEPASPHQKGSIENGNGVIRLEFQRDYDVDSMKQECLNKVVRSINNRPMKCLDYKTPLEEFKKYGDIR